MIDFPAIFQSKISNIKEEIEEWKTRLGQKDEAVAAMIRRYQRDLGNVPFYFNCIILR